MQILQSTTENKETSGSDESKKRKMESVECKESIEREELRVEEINMFTISKPLQRQILESVVKHCLKKKHNVCGRSYFKDLENKP